MVEKPPAAAWPKRTRTEREREREREREQHVRREKKRRVALQTGERGPHSGAEHQHGGASRTVSPFASKAGGTHRQHPDPRAKNNCNTARRDRFVPVPTPLPRIPSLVSLKPPRAAKCT